MAQLGTTEAGLSTIVGANVHGLRVLTVPKLSQDDLARRAGIHVETVRMIEAARDPSKRQLDVRLSTIRALADALGVQPADLLAYDSPTRVWLNPAA
jgi:DNA-binding Xre family transcriptional regulator